MAKKAFNPVCQQREGDHIFDFECGEPAVAWVETRGWRGWACEFHKLQLKG
jgi:hypothetical protein